MSEFKIFDVRQSNARDELAQLLNCPKLRFYYEDEEVLGNNGASNFADCQCPFLLFDDRSHYKRLLTDAKNGFGFETADAAAQYFEQVKDAKTVYMLTQDLGHVDDAHKFLFKDGDRLDAYLDSIQLPLYERRIQVHLLREKELIVTETIGNNLSVTPLEFLDVPTKRSYSILNIEDRELKAKLQSIFIDYDVSLEDVSFSTAIDPEDRDGKKSVTYFSSVGKKFYLVVVKDEDSQVACFLGAKGNDDAEFNSRTEAERAVKQQSAVESAYIPISNAWRSGCLVGNVVSNSSKVLLDHMLKQFPDHRLSKRLSIFCFCITNITRSELYEGKLLGEDTVRLQLVNFY